MAQYFENYKKLNFIQHSLLASRLDMDVPKVHQVQGMELLLREVDVVVN
ncbi:hypothetical protein SLEP1_g45236 [Rubroshorea leprosula]|uniref:Uncharacterized protein n=1 Tax=Rubroshorea leprosula TaxID=152421 RepID=A0AAV5LII0_9ROSI|nr:hypothetical protein SLEP1_g45236 [Rubroshorea leprosula]